MAWPDVFEDLEQDYKVSMLEALLWLARQDCSHFPNEEPCISCKAREVVEEAVWLTPGIRTRLKEAGAMTINGTMYWDA